MIASATRQTPAIIGQMLMPAFAPEESAEFEAGEAAGVANEAALGADVTVDNTPRHDCSHHGEASGRWNDCGRGDGRE